MTQFTTQTFKTMHDFNAFIYLMTHRHCAYVRRVNTFHTFESNSHGKKIGRKTSIETHVSHTYLFEKSSQMKMYNTSKQEHRLLELNTHFRLVHTISTHTFPSSQISSDSTLYEHRNIRLTVCTRTIATIQHTLQMNNSPVTHAWRMYARFNL